MSQTFSSNVTAHCPSTTTPIGQTHRLHSSLSFDFAPVPVSSNFILSVGEGYFRPGSVHTTPSSFLNVNLCVFRYLSIYKDFVII
mmetsp:Transcript_36195/g.76277  ORF Transcript_36195/g.76277 Transcript_36195/m.76277 type:complete len:85 (-) Transcript_36195:12-266(-)